jgi:hypothetical protein
MSDLGKHDNDTGHNRETENPNNPTIDVIRSRSRSNSSERLPSDSLQRQAGNEDLREHYASQAARSLSRSSSESNLSTLSDSQSERSDERDPNRLHPGDQSRQRRGRGLISRREGSPNLRDLSEEHGRNAEGWKKLRRQLSNDNAGPSSGQRPELPPPYVPRDLRRGSSESDLGRLRARNPEEPLRRGSSESDLRRPAQHGSDLPSYSQQEQKDALEAWQTQETQPLQPLDPGEYAAVVPGEPPATSSEPPRYYQGVNRSDLGDSQAEKQKQPRRRSSESDLGRLRAGNPEEQPLRRGPSESDPPPSYEALEQADLASMMRPTQPDAPQPERPETPPSQQDRE